MILVAEKAHISRFGPEACVTLLDPNTRIGYRIVGLYASSKWWIDGGSIPSHFCPSDRAYCAKIALEAIMEQDAGIR